jgi:hypothetical protein
MPNPIPGVGTSLNPAVVVSPDAKTVFIAWKGEGNDQRIFWTRTTELSPDPTTGLYSFNPSPQSLAWSPYAAGGNQVFGTSHSPSLASFRGTEYPNTVYMAWKGVEGDDRIFWSSLADSVYWQPQTPVLNASTKLAPAIVATDTSIILVWKNASDNNIWWATSGYDLQANSINFDVMGPINVGGTFFQTNNTPALAFNPGTPGLAGSALTMAWSDTGGNLHWAICNIKTDNYQWGKQQRIDPLNFSTSLGAGPTYASPALLDSPGSGLVMAWVEPGGVVRPGSQFQTLPHVMISFPSGPNAWKFYIPYQSADSTPAFAGDLPGSGPTFFFKESGDATGIYYDWFFGFELPPDGPYSGFMP